MLHIPDKPKRWNEFSGLPPTHMRGLAYTREDGTAAADPDPSIRFQLRRDMLSHMGAGGD